METLGKFFAGLFLFIVALMVRGWVVMKLWGWLIVPTFDLNPLRLIEALGLSLVVSLLTIQKIEPNEDDALTSAITGILFNLIFLLVGWVYTLFM